MSGRALRSNKHRALAKRVLLGPIDENTAVVIADGKNQACSDIRNVTLMDEEEQEREIGFLAGFDGSKEAHIVSFIMDVEKELEKRKLSMDAETENLCLQLETIKQSSFVKLNKSIRKMSVKHFLEHYGGDLDTSCRAILGALPSNEDISSNNRDVIGKVDEFGRPLRTPARVLDSSTRGSHNSARTPATVRRAAKKGEILFSENGSPIDIDELPKANDDVVLLSVHKKRDASTTMSSSSSAAAVISINVGGKNDINIDLSNPDSMITNLDPQQLALAIQQLKSFQDQVGDLMGKFAKSL